MEDKGLHTRGMWDEPIAELKIGGINGISFKRNQVFGKRRPLVDNELVICDIKRELDDVDDETFLVFAKVNNEGQPRLLKSWKGKEYYVTFDIYSEEE